MPSVMRVLKRVTREGKRRGIWMVLTALALVVAGCGAAPDSQVPAQARSTQVGGRGSVIDRAGPVVVLRNPAPATLDVSLSVTLDELSGDAEPMTEVGLEFSTGGKAIQFAGDERVTCDGVDVPLQDRVAIFQVLRVPTKQAADTTLHCDYTAGGLAAGLSLQIPAAPVITSPQAGAQVARSPHTLVTYRYDPATCTLLGVVALANPRSPIVKAIARMNTPGPLQATIDTSGFAPGAGSLVLTAGLTPHVAATGVPFKSVSAAGSASSTASVAWV